MNFYQAEWAVFGIIENSCNCAKSPTFEVVFHVFMGKKGTKQTWAKKVQNRQNIYDKLQMRNNNVRVSYKYLIQIFGFSHPFKLPPAQ